MAGNFALRLIAIKFIVFTAAGAQLNEFENTDVTPGNVPILPISGTGLFTGIYYKLGLQRFPLGWVTWTEKSTPDEGWNYLQIDARSDHSPFFQKGSVWYNNVQWYFEESKTDPGWYNLKTRQLPDSVARINRDHMSDNGYYIVLSKHVDPSKRDDALWKPLQQGGIDSEFYKLIVKSEPDATVTWTETLVSPDVSNQHFIQADINSDPVHRRNYQTNQKWFLDSLFRFEPVDRDVIRELQAQNL